MTYHPDHEGISRYLNEDQDLRSCLEGRARLGLAAAQAAAPRGRPDEGDRSIGSLAASGHVVYNGAHSGGPMHDRMSYSVVFDDPAAVPIIFGTSDTPAHTGMLDAALAVMGDVHHNPGA